MSVRRFKLILRKYNGFSRDTSNCPEQLLCDMNSTTSSLWG